MGEKLIVGPINKGLRNDRTAFVIDNDSFPTLVNAYQWRGRVKRKRGTALLSRLNRYFNSGTNTIALVAGNGNLLTGFMPLDPLASIVPGTVTLIVAAVTYTDPAKDGTLSPGGTINYATGAITIPGGGVSTLTAKFTYYPTRPVMGLCDLRPNTAVFPVYPGTIGFDDRYSYQFSAVTGANHDVSYYKNPLSVVGVTSAPPPGGYQRKADWSPVTWSAADSQQFWGANFQGAFWVTNGKPGMQFDKIHTIAWVSSVKLRITTDNAPPIKSGDFVFINEITSDDADPTRKLQKELSINQLSGVVTSVVVGSSFDVTFPTLPGPPVSGANIINPTTGGGTAYVGGMIQFLTNQRTDADPIKDGDGIRWYDGDPTSGIPSIPNTNLGWVNFAPPLSKGVFSIGNAPAAQYYLVGAKMIIPFKDRLVFFGPYIQTSNQTSSRAIYLQDAIIYSQNGTVYYTCAFDANLPQPQYIPVLVPETTPSVPTQQTATQSAFWEDLPGYGGYISSGTNQVIKTANANEDVILVGFQTSLFTRLVYTGNDLLPFIFYSINQELGASSTFSSITLDKGALSIGNFGLTITTQNSVDRIDLAIPDAVFEISAADENVDRICSQRDFINEWIYFTYNKNVDPTPLTKYPNQTLQYNYRDNSWAIFTESYTTYGTYRNQTVDSWNELLLENWDSWGGSWVAGVASVRQPVVIGGTQHGFVLKRGVDTDEDPSLAIQDLTTGGLVTSPEHGLQNNDYVLIKGCIGDSSVLNGSIFQIASVTTNDFILISPLPVYTTYLGGGTLTRIYVPFIQTKQFPIAWDMGRKTRIGTQRYLFTRTESGELAVLIFLSQDGSTPYNFGPILPSPDTLNEALVYSDVLFTCPEYNSIVSPITGISKAENAVVTTQNTLAVGQEVLITDVIGMTEVNKNTYTIIARTPSAITLDLDSTLFSTYVSGGNVSLNTTNLMTPTADTQAQIWHRMNTSLIGDTVQVGFTLTDEQLRDPNITFEEIELHSFIFDISPSQMLI